MKPSLLVLASALLAAPTAARAADLALVGARVYPSPDAAPIDNAVVLLHGHDIAAVGKRGAVNVPAGARTLDVRGKTVVAGFWNSHVHFTEPVFADAAHAPAATLTEHLRKMLLRWGVTTAFDLGAPPASTNALHERIERGELDGPRLLLAASVFPAGPNPSYLPPEMALPKASTPDEAARLARDGMVRAGDGLKLFTGVFMGRGNPVRNMSVEMARAATAVAHAAGKPVFAHPQNHAGVACALAAGVDVLAHTIPTEGHFSDDELARARAQHTALIPTLTLWRVVTRDAPPTVVDTIVKGGADELAQWQHNGGTILFGTDVGFQDQYDTTQELADMARVLSWRTILASLTSAPAAFFHAPDRGRIAAGLRADVVVLDGDPALDPRNMAKVAYTIRDGRIIFQRP
jgi:imidazolonepropionase-like amidohydrolase